jgi:hypothetical protein
VRACVCACVCVGGWVGGGGGSKSCRADPHHVTFNDATLKTSKEIEATQHGDHSMQSADLLLRESAVLDHVHENDAVVVRHLPHGHPVVSRVASALGCVTSLRRRCLGCLQTHSACVRDTCDQCVFFRDVTLCTLQANASVQ